MMGRRRTFVRMVPCMLLLLSITPSIQGQSEFGFGEDFEDDTAGAAIPTSPHYAFAKTGSNPERMSFEVVTPGFDGTGQKLQLLPSSGSSGNRGVFTLNEPHQFTTISFYMICLSGGNPSNPTIAPWFSFAGSGGKSFSVLLGSTGGGCNVSASKPGGCAAPANYLVSAFGEHLFEITFDWTAKTMQVRVTGGGGVVFDNSVPFCDAAANSITRFEFEGSSANTIARATHFDQILFDGGPLVVEENVPLEPDEFDTGLAKLLASMGLVTPESQMFFVVASTGVVLVGMSGALSWTSPGRLKNGILVGTLSLLGVFMVFFGYLQFWMLLVTIVLGAFLSFGGAKILRNTYYDIQDALRRAGVPGFRDRGGETITDAQAAMLRLPGDRERIEEGDDS